MGAITAKVVEILALRAMLEWLQRRVFGGGRNEKLAAGPQPHPLLLQAAQPGPHGVGPSHEDQPTESGSNWAKIYRDVCCPDFVGNALVCHVMGITDEWNHPAFFAYYDRVFSGDFGASVFSATPGWVITA